MSPYLNKRVRSFDEAVRDRIFSDVKPKIENIRRLLDWAETECLKLAECVEIGCDADEAARDLASYLAEEVTKDYLVPLERAVQEYLDSEEIPDAPVGRAR